MEKKKKIIKSISVGLLAVFLLFGNTAFAATLAVSPASGSYENGKTFSVSVNVASSDQSMNAASATVAFPTDKLQVVSVGKTGSIVDFWAVEPTFSNTAGTVKFEGVVLPPGYIGANGKLVTITFKGKSVGVAGLAINASSILANDGAGTPISKGATGATFNITPVKAPAPETIDLEEEIPVEETVPESLACEPDSLIYSTTHPGQVWRKENTAVFSWDVNENIVASRIAFDKSPSTEPETLSKPAIVEKKYENLADGTWYFHLSLQDNDGWSETEHFKVKIDATAPEINLSEIPRGDLTNPKIVLDLDIDDKISCVRDFTINIDGQKVDFNKLPNGNLELETIEPGEHELAVIAYDRAGNQNEAFMDVVVKALEAPIINEYQAEVRNAGELFVKGETLQNANLTAKITSKNNSFLAREDFQSGSGKWTWSPGTKLRSGNYFISFKVSDARGASSNWSEPIAVRVGGGMHIDIAGLINKIPPEVAMIGLVVVGIFLIVILTRALTIRRLKREHEDWE